MHETVGLASRMIDFAGRYGFILSFSRSLTKSNSPILFQISFCRFENAAVVLVTFALDRLIVPLVYWAFNAIVNVALLKRSPDCFFVNDLLHENSLIATILVSSKYYLVKAR